MYQFCVFIRYLYCNALIIACICKKEILMDKRRYIIKKNSLLIF
ncbi:unnamed protein product [Musa acuminata subsp. malaccensis]|uniref:(wild Malaysian banana) hypothetical protein n=1 Tax=Musa acuminata subsp. malaccensis TaxID=214687 RepID=A0A804IWF1_MUSAM|nr:unnamed protein product [Musa acuminata subsp. malaccensis]